ncbi:MAG: uncharacterized protein QOG96_6782, partial [Pseudonocardiales bacterium]|nr:uncharacterized protein [Pseudonocardiales bacterium]
MTPGVFALLVGAGVAAGLSGSIAGLASLFSYPALLAAGLPATSANVTNTVSLAVGSVSSITSSRPELVGQAGTARKLGAICAVGGAAGAGLLLLSRRNPVPLGTPMPAPPGPPRRRPGVLVGVLAVSVYGGYFGAAAGVLMLALLATVLPETLMRVNALKNVLLGLANVIAA